MKSFKYIIFILGLLSLVACKENLTEEVDNGEWNKERNILGITFEGQIGKAIISRDGSDAHLTFTYNVAVGEIDAVKIKDIEISYGATSSITIGENLNFDNENKSASIEITPKHGDPLTWIIYLEEFEEPLLGSWNIAGLYVFGGTGPSYGGAAIIKMSSKSWCWPSDGPQAEEDNIVTFELDGIDDSGNTYGTLMNDAGADDTYADFRFVNGTDVDVNHFYRKLPQGEGKWYRDYAKETLTIEFPNGQKETCVFLEPGEVDAGEGTTRTLATHSLMFSLKGVDDWSNIYNDYDKFVSNPRKYWIDIKK